MSIVAKHYDTVRMPLVSEKSAQMQAENKYVFKIATVATKADVKEAVEALFKVQVDAVKIVNVKGKSKTFRFRAGARQDYKKAYVKIKDGQSIDFGLKA